MTRPRLRVGWLMMMPVVALLSSSCAWIALLAQNHDLVEFDLGHAVFSTDGLHVAYQDTFRPEPNRPVVGIDDLASGSHSGLSRAAEPSLSGDGHLVAIRQWGQVGEKTQVIVHNRINGTDVLVSANLAGGRSNGWSATPAISGDGHFVAFSSSSSDLVPNRANGGYDLYLRDLARRTTQRLSVGSAGEDPDGESAWPAISRDGSFVAFESGATNLVAGDADLATDVFVRDVGSGRTVRASVAVDGGDPDGESHHAAISSDGRYVAFSSSASNLVADDTNGVDDVFVRDLATGTTTRVSVSTDGTQANGPSRLPSISAYGKVVAFDSAASNLVADDTNGAYDVFVHDRSGSTTVRVSLDVAGRQGDGDSYGPALSGDARFVAFVSKAPNLAPIDADTRQIVLVRAVAPPTVAAASPATAAPATTTTVTIYGTGFTAASTVAADTGISIGAITPLSTTRLRVTISVAADASPGFHPLVVQTPGPGPGLITASIGGCATCFAVTG